MSKKSVNNGNEILENSESWSRDFQSGWLSYFQKMGFIEWDLYNPPRNRTAVSGKGIELDKSRLMLISSAGAYLAASQQSFDASSPLGDYTVRKLPAETQFEDLSYAHEHYDHTALNSDPQVLLPLNYLREMVEEKLIGELSPIVSFMGYQPNAAQVAMETVPAIIKIAQDEKITAALLVPA